MKNKIDDKTIFLIGSGPSLNKTDVRKLKGYNSISFNRSYIAYEDWGFAPNHYMICDYRLMHTIRNDIMDKVICRDDVEKFVLVNPMLYYDRPHADVYMKNRKVKISGWIETIKHEYSDKLEMFEPSNEKEVFPTPGNVVGFSGNAGACALNVLYKLGFNKVILLGIDAYYVPRIKSIRAGKDLSHFRDDYFDVIEFRETSTHGPDNEESRTMLWEAAARGTEVMDDFEIISSTPDSEINEFFEYVPFDNWFNEDEEEDENE